jgi:hypothetical protein
MYGGLVVLEWPKHGAVTISEKARGYTLGIGGYIEAQPAVYKGRGWKDELYADAIKALQDIWPDALK